MYIYTLLLCGRHYKWKVRTSAEEKICIFILLEITNLDIKFRRESTFTNRWDSNLAYIGNIFLKSHLPKEINNPNVNIVTVICHTQPFLLFIFSVFLVIFFWEWVQPARPLL